MRLTTLLFLVACSGGKPAVPPDPAPAGDATEAIPADPGPPSVMPDPAPVAQPAPEPTQASLPPAPVSWGDVYAVMAPPTLNGTVLTVDVRYGGGCQTHAFTPRPGPRTADAPTRQPIVLHHDAHGDTCRALKYETLTLDLADALEDCTESVLLLVPPGDDGKSEYALTLTAPMGCD